VSKAKANGNEKSEVFEAGDMERMLSGKKVLSAKKTLDPERRGQGSHGGMGSHPMSESP